MAVETIETTETEAAETIKTVVCVTLDGGLLQAQLLDHAGDGHVVGLVEAAGARLDKGQQRVGGTAGVVLRGRAGRRAVGVCIAASISIAVALICRAIAIGTPIGRKTAAVGG